MADKRELNFDSFDRLARALANVPLSTGEQLFKGDPLQRIQWLNNMLDVDDSDDSDQEIRNRKKKEALAQIRIRPEDLDAILEVLEQVHTLQLIVPNQVSGSEYNQPLSIWRHAYEQFSRKLILQKMEGRLQIISKIESILHKHRTPVAANYGAGGFPGDLVTELVDFCESFRELADRGEPAVEAVVFETRKLPMAVGGVAPPVSNYFLHSTSASEMGY